MICDRLSDTCKETYLENPGKPTFKSGLPNYYPNVK